MNKCLSALSSIVLCSFVCKIKRNLQAAPNGFVKNWIGFCWGVNKSVCFDNSYLPQCCFIWKTCQNLVGLHSQSSEKMCFFFFWLKLSCKIFTDIFFATRIQPFLCVFRCQKAGQQGSTVVRPLFPAEC